MHVRLRAGSTCLGTGRRLLINLNVSIVVRAVFHATDTDQALARVPSVRHSELQALVSRPPAGAL